MAGHQHGIMGEAAYLSLPLWEHKCWEAQEESIPHYCFFPDLHLMYQRQPEKEEELSPYTVMPNGMVIPHGPCDEKYTLCIFSHCHSRDVTAYVITYYMTKIVELLMKESYEEAAKFAGTFAHFLQDSCCPGHVANNYLLAKLMPPPPGKYWHIHRVIDAWPCELKDIQRVKPRLLGTSIDEAVFNLGIEYDKAVGSALEKICPSIQAVYDEDNGKMQRIVNEWCGTGTHIVASAWHTAFSLANNRFEECERNMLERIHLSDVIPVDEMADEYFYELNGKHIKDLDAPKPPYLYGSDPPRSKGSKDPYGFQALNNSACDGKGNTIPLSLRVLEGDRLVEKVFVQGLAAAGTSKVVFQVNGDIHKELRVLAGLHSRMGPEGAAVFEVYLDEGDYTVPLRSAELTPEGPAHEFVIPLQRDCRTIMLLTEGSPDAHVIWADPVLIRRGEARK